MRFLLNRTDAIGDTVLTLPCIEALKKKYPNCMIALVVSEKTFSLFNIYKNVDYVFTIEKKDSFFKRLSDWLRIFKSFAPSHYIYFGGDELAHLVAFLKGVKFRGGLVSRFLSFLFLNKGIRQSRSKILKHESILNVELLKELDVEKDIIMPTFEVGINDFEKVKKKCLDSGIDFTKDFKYLVIHPGMTGHSPNWPLEYYVELIDKLKDHFKIIISYTYYDAAVIDKLKLKLKMEDICYLDGLQLGLDGYFSFLRLCHGFIGPSTGTTHIAGIANIALWSFYSPFLSQRAERWSPMVLECEKLHIFTPVVNQQKDAMSSKNAYDVMKEISVDEVFDSILKYFGVKDEINE